MPYAEIFEAFPSELRLPMARLVDVLKADFDVKHTDFEDLKAATRALTTAQARTEARMEELAAAQARTEARMEELAAAQARTEVRLEELAETQMLFRRTFISQIGGLGARWGLQSEEAFRNGIRTILEEVGFTTERYLTWDATGAVFGHPEQIELDVVVQNGKRIVVEIKSSLDRANTYLFQRKVDFYVQHTGQHIDRRIIVAPYADARAQAIATRLGIEICTDVSGLASILRYLSLATVRHSIVNRRAVRRHGIPLPTSPCWCEPRP